MMVKLYEIQAYYHRFAWVLESHYRAMLACNLTTLHRGATAGISALPNN